VVIVFLAFGIHVAQGAWIVLPICWPGFARLPFKACRIQRAGDSE